MTKAVKLIILLLLVCQIYSNSVKWGPFNFNDWKKKAEEVVDDTKKIIENNKDKISEIYDVSIKIVDNLMNTSNIKSAFIKWMDFMKRPYNLGSLEFLRRLEIFTTNFLKIQKLSKNNDKLKLGLTFRSDITDEELQKNYLMDPNVVEEYNKLYQSKQLESEREDDSDAKAFLLQNRAYDWSNLFHYNKVQGACGSCWVFAFVSAIEGMLVKNYNDKTKLATAPILECYEVNTGCNGGNSDFAHKLMSKIGGLPKEESNPYMYGVHGGSKGYKKCKVGNHVKPYAIAKTRNDCWGKNCILNLLANGPVVISIDPFFDEFTFARELSSFSNAPCSRTSHAVLLVGYNPRNLNNDNDDTVKIKNSWENWGDSRGIVEFTFRRYGNQIVNVNDYSSGSLKVNQAQSLEDCGIFNNGYQPTDVVLLQK